MFDFILILFILLTLFYAFKIVYFFYGLYRFSIGKNEEKYSVTVLVPARNEEANISKCLDSLLNQNYPSDKLEIVVIDDDSEDSTAEIVNDYAAQHSIIRLISLSSMSR